MLAGGAVTGEKLAPGAVTEAALAGGAVTGDKLHPDIAITTTGTITAGSFMGDGSGLTGLPSGGLSLPFTGEANLPGGFALSISNAGTRASGISGTGTDTGVFGEAGGHGVWGLSQSGGGTGVYGEATAGTGTTFGVFGHVTSPDGRGIFGLASATSGANRGVYGRSNSPNGYGVYGEATATSGFTYGVYGESKSTNGRGVFGVASAFSGTTIGVAGVSWSTGGRGVVGTANGFTSGTTVGVWGQSESNEGRGVYGVALNTSGVNYGVYGESKSSTGRAVYGLASAGIGKNYGVYGASQSTDGIGVFGETTATSGTGYGVYGRAGAGTGVFGVSLATAGTSYGVMGIIFSTSGAGVYGQTASNGGLTSAVLGEANSTDGYAAHFRGVAGSRNYFQRRVGIGETDPQAMLHVTGGSWNLTTSEGDLKIGSASHRLKIGVAIDGAGAGRVHVRAQGGVHQIVLGANESDVAVVSESGFWPFSTGTYTLGTSTRRWTEVHAVNGTIQTSDATLKQDIADLSYGIDEVMRLRPVTFRWIGEAEGKTRVGLLAQEVRAVVPEVVNESDGGPLGLNYAELVPVLIKSLQDQQARIEQLSEIIRALQQTIASAQASETPPPGVPESTPSLKARN
jgi:hypothetical protein